MCFSAEVIADYKIYVQRYGAVIDLRDFYDLYCKRTNGGKQKIPKAIDAWFTEAGASGEYGEIGALIGQYRAARERTLQQELFKQKKRLGDAERILQSKTTKKAQNDRRISTDKLAKLKFDLDDLHRSELRHRDARIFPGTHGPVMVWENGKRVIRPMRYQCRLPGWNETVERKYPGTYNARRDRLPVVWKALFGHRHGVMIVKAFYENVERHKMEHRELAPSEASENVVLEFRPRPDQDMVIACLWNASPNGQEHLLSYAAITDDPAPEVAAAGHDRTVIQIKPENIERWLTPEGRSLDELQAILDDRPEAYYEHRVSKAA